MTSLALTTALTSSPSARPSRSAELRVIVEVIVPSPRSTTTSAMTSSCVIDWTVPDSSVRALSTMGSVRDSGV
jgi:hypothetical protein